jgi:regulatory protein
LQLNLLIEIPLHEKTPEFLSFKQIKAKLEYYCAYQERCYKEVDEKMYTYKLNTTEKEELLLYLIENNFINEERFAKSFARGKHNYKFWGKARIIQELKFRNISSKLIELALKEIPETTYIANFNALAEKFWESNTDRKGIKKNKKCIDFLLRKGYESHLVYDKIKELEQE